VLASFQPVSSKPITSHVLVMV